MKKLFLFGAIALLLATVGCGDDEKKVEKEKERIAGETPQELLGRWVLTGYGSEKGIVPVEGNCKDYYEITFFGDKVNGNGFHGFTENSVVGVTFKIYPTLQELEIKSFFAQEKGEKCQWDLFQKSLKKITHYDFSSNNELLLYFNDKTEWVILKRPNWKILREIPKFYAKGNIEIGEQKIIQTKEELLAVFSQETIDKVEGLSGIDFTTQTFLFGCDSYHSRVSLIRYRYSQMDATTYRLFVEISAVSPFPDGNFKYGVVVPKIPENGIVVFKIIKR